jgi:UDP-glucose 4-epimerase
LACTDFLEKIKTLTKMILVTGGCGYIGSHTIVQLLQHGYQVVSIDNNSRSYTWIHDNIEAIAQTKVPLYNLNLCDKAALRQVFETHKITGIIHFAAYKTVPESVVNPLLYFENNLVSLINLLQCAADFNVDNFVFSSSCSVYGNANELPVTEQTPLQPVQSPYARTKQMGEEILNDFAAAHPQFKAALLRYFNPAGAHHSGTLGDLPTGIPDNLVPYITQTANGTRQKLSVFGNDYPTRDGTCIRDYIHVVDIAEAHVQAIDYLQKQTQNTIELFNLGSGVGSTVLEAVDAFEQSTGIKLNYEIAPRRAGDVVAVYANNQKAQTILHWHTKHTLKDMMHTAWQWQQYLDQRSIGNNA